MKHAHGNPFFAGGPTFDSARFRAFTIGPRSEFSEVLVNGELVCAGRLSFIECNGTPTVTGSRGRFRLGSSVTGIRGANYSAHVIGFECGDQLVNTGPRAPRVYRELVTLPAGEWVARAVPFQGRRHAVVRFPIVTGVAIDYYAVGARFPDADTLAQVSTELVYSTALLGTIGVPVAVAVTADDANANHLGHEGTPIGSSDGAKYHDEIVVWMKSPVGGGGSTCVLEVEVAGEEGCA